nr:hypothetical protein [Pandoravirus belohorizontensis]
MDVRAQPHKDQTAAAGGGLDRAPGRPRDVITQDRLLDALWCAVRYDRVDALRYLTAHDTPLGRRGRSLVGARLLTAAVGHNSVAIVACLHGLLAPDGAASCRCTCAVGEAAWDSLTPDAALWLRDARCAGYVKPRSFHISKAISRGHAAHVARMMEAYGDPCVLPDGGVDGKDAAGVRPPAGVPAVGRAVSMAAAAGNMAMMDVAIRSLCRDAFPIIVGAARGGRVDVLSWATAPDGPCVAALGLPTTEMMRAAAVAAVLSDRASSLHWMAHRFPDAITPTLLWTAVSSNAAGAFGALCHLVEGPIAWSGLLGEAMASGSLAVVRLLVEQKHIDIDPLCVVSSGLGSDGVADYVCQRLANDQLQIIIDIAGSHANPDYARRKLLKRMRKRAPHLCLATCHAVDIAGMGDPYSEPMAVCACSKCADPDDVVPTSPPPPIKRPRVDASQEVPPPPSDP